MKERIGVVVNRVPGVRNAITMARRAEELGLSAAWVTSGAGEDCMPLLAALALQTDAINLGTSVVQTYPRHPMTLASEANVIDQLAPGRFRLGIGPSHRSIMESMGLGYANPLGHLREYLVILKELTATGSVVYNGDYYQATGTIGRRAEIPIMVGTLQRSTFELVGGLGDGAITWLCPSQYLADTAIPAMRQAASIAGRTTPKLIAHLAVCLHDDADAVRDEVRRNIPNIGFPSYQRMLVAAGYPSAADGIWTDQLIDSIIAWGDEAHVSSRLEQMFEAGADEVLVRPIGVGSRSGDVIGRTLDFIGSL